MLKIIVLLFILIVIIIVSNYFSYNDNENFNADSINALTDDITNLADKIVDSVNEMVNEDIPDYGEPKTRQGYPVSQHEQEHNDNLKQYHHVHSYSTNCWWCNPGTNICMRSPNCGKNTYRTRGKCEEECGKVEQETRQYYSASLSEEDNANELNKYGSTSPYSKKCWWCNPGSGDGICMADPKCSENTYKTRQKCEEKCGNGASFSPDSAPGLPQVKDIACYAQAQASNNTTGVFCGGWTPIGRVGLEGKSVCKKPLRGFNTNCKELCLNTTNSNPDLCNKNHHFKSKSSDCCQGWFYPKSKNGDCDHPPPRDPKDYVSNPYCPIHKLPSKQYLE